MFFNAGIQYVLETQQKVFTASGLWHSWWFYCLQLLRKGQVLC